MTMRCIEWRRLLRSRSPILSISSPPLRLWPRIMCRLLNNLAGEPGLCPSLSPPRILPSASFDALRSDQLVEEETLPGYKPENFYPVRLGDVFNDRFQVVAKLGYGLSSTIWLARDLQ
jgi:hypothetical protein